MLDGFGCPPDSNNAEHPVKGESSFSENFGEPPLTSATDDVHLPEPVLRMNESEADHQIVLAGCLDVGNPKCISRNIDSEFKSGKHDGTAHLWKRLVELVPEEEKTCDSDDGEHEGQSDNHLQPF